LQYIFGVAVDISIRRTLTARLKRYDVCFWHFSDMTILPLDVL